jgi:predicted small secreted protein
MMSFRRLILSLFILSFATALAGCGDTWRGLKKDTGENMEKSGDAVSGAGKKVQP